MTAVDCLLSVQTIASKVRIASTGVQGRPRALLTCADGVRASQELSCCKTLKVFGRAALCVWLQACRAASVWVGHRLRYQLHDQGAQFEPSAWRIQAAVASQQGWQLSSSIALGVPWRSPVQPRTRSFRVPSARQQALHHQLRSRGRKPLLGADS